MLKSLAKSFLIALILSPALRADTIWVGTGGGVPLELRAVQITRIGDGKIYFSSAGREASRPALLK